jgi:hypothetical protein
MKFKVYYKDELIMSTDSYVVALKEIYDRIKADNTIKREDFNIYQLTAK